ncbi:DUF4188 domain-containing protein [Alteriqipengyuania lutimaris]|uniref:DUF4188 domain-containing protein n=2 Tax=Alteriqipengyuania lutimaris TaxID=1538146 RepID=A0A395LV83_9SPHN|nr:DUF4188 domain-containing protein [Alteriqipengyuania lutimaris]MBB3032552.1 hypothetical protein [Alteriqipengyuania lutimaris]RDS78320.1 DUF4188 domain-containing protein [Alteriqipengyuania lutimaris]
MGVIAGRKTAAFSGPLVVFVIGMRINHFHKIGQWLPVMRAMPPMLEELASNPESGFLGSQNLLAGLRQVCLLQYWRDFDSLEAYARSRDQQHWPAWVAFNKRVGSDGTVGIFHETYAVDGGRYETVYANMPEWGLGKVAGLRDASGSRNEARSRMKATAE